jgi:LPS-assembly protein
MKKQLALSTIVLFLSAPSLADTKCKMTSSGNRVCGSQDKISTAKPSDSSFFSFWNNDKDEETNTTTPKTSIKKNEAKDIEEQPNNNSDNVVENEDVKKQNNLANSKKLLVEESQQIQKEINNSYLSATTGDSSKGVVLNCGKSSLLFPKQTLSTDTESLDVLADRSEISGKDLYQLTGNVSLNSSEYYLAANKINIRKSTKTSTAEGDVKFQDKEVMFLGDRAIVNKKKGITYTSLENVNFHYPESKVNGYAKKVTNDGIEQVFSSASYSLCPLGQSDWRVKAQQITLNSEKNKGVAKNATVEFFGIPIAYIPHHEWILEGKGSGFLSPTFGTQGNGYQIKIPYYFNIAPDKDFLLTLNHISDHGSALEGKYRQLISSNNYWGNGRLEFEGHYLSKDDITKNSRWLIDSKLDLPINLDDENAISNLSIVVKQVSDKDYLKDMTDRGTSSSALLSHLDLTYQEVNKNLDISLFAESEQLINNGTATYTRVPELSISKSFEALNSRNINLSLISTKFAHKNSNITTNTTGLRTHTQANFSRSVLTDAYSLIPSLNLSTTNYMMDDVSNQNRSIGSFNIDSKLFLERETNIFDKDLIQTLIPRLSYNYTPKKNQSALPNFDSADKNDSYESLFSSQKFTGIDRISNANSFTLGLESDFIDEEIGGTYLSLKAAQTIHLDNQDMDSDGNLVDRRKYSNVAVSADFSLNNLAFNNALQYNPETNTVDQHDSTITYMINSRKFLTLAHHNDNGIKSAEIYSVYPINQQIHVLAGGNYSITNSTMDKTTAGIVYDSCCWAVRLVYFDENNNDESISLELVLKGLATTSPSLYKRLEEDIPNYLANLDD